MASKKGRNGRQTNSIHEFDEQTMERAAAAFGHRFAHLIVQGLRNGQRGHALTQSEPPGGQGPGPPGLEEATAEGLVELSKKYHAARAAIARLHKMWGSAGPDAAWSDADLDAFAEPMRQRMSQLSFRIAQAQATSVEELAYKASVVLDWIDESEGDMADLLAASLCRDLVQAHPPLSAPPSRLART